MSGRDNVSGAPDLSHLDICNALFALRSKLRSSEAMLAQIRGNLSPEKVAEWEASIERERQVVARFEAASLQAARWIANGRDHAPPATDAPEPASFGFFGNVTVGNTPTATWEEYPGLGRWWVQLRIGPKHETVLARVYADDIDSLRARANAIAMVLNEWPRRASTPPAGGGDADLSRLADEMQRQHDDGRAPWIGHDDIATIRRLASGGGARVGQEDGVALIAAERQRQVSVEGWTPEHDAEHDMAELACAAACYATPHRERALLLSSGVPDLWPWDKEWWKPGDRIRELTKAGALIAAEIDRLKRAAPTPETQVVAG